MADIPLPINPLHQLLAHPEIGPMLMQLVQRLRMQQQNPMQVSAGGGMFGGVPKGNDQGEPMDVDGMDAKPYPPKPKPNPQRKEEKQWVDPFTRDRRYPNAGDMFDLEDPGRQRGK